jgi:hypothetical protein
MSELKKVTGYGLDSHGLVLSRGRDSLLAIMLTGPGTHGY